MDQVYALRLEMQPIGDPSNFTINSPLGVPFSRYLTVFKPEEYRRAMRPVREASKMNPDGWYIGYVVRFDYIDDPDVATKVLSIASTTAKKGFEMAALFHKGEERTEWWNDSYRLTSGKEIGIRTKFNNTTDVDRFGWDTVLHYNPTKVVALPDFCSHVLHTEVEKMHGLWCVTDVEKF